MPVNKLINFSLDTNFRFYCDQLPLLSEMAQDVTVPPITLPPAELYNRFVDYSEPGEKIQYQELDIGFIMDENFDIYAEVYSWMSKIAGPPGMSPVAESERKLLVADAEVHILNNAQKLVRKLIFRDAWPSTIGAVPFQTTSEGVTTKGIVTMMFTAMELSPHDKDLTGLGSFNYNH